jgi:S-adenosyl-L-methionine hydrolase (adenosine-forming)
MRRSQSAAPIALLTDFGYRDHYAGAMRGVLASMAPGAALLDITHGIPPQSIAAGAIALRESWRFFPSRTVFLVVVDPGVGTSRLPIAVETRAGARFVGPDNGVLSLAVSEAGIKRAVRLESKHHRLAKPSSTFHGRDIFAPAAAFLSRGTRLGTLGSTLARIKPLHLPKPDGTAGGIRGKVLYVDAFGNLITNISRKDVALLNSSFPGKQVSVRIRGGAPMKIVNTYGDARSGAILATFGSFELLEIAVRDASAATRLGCGVGAKVVARMARS